MNGLVTCRSVAVKLKPFLGGKRGILREEKGVKRDMEEETRKEREGRKKGVYEDR